MHVPAGIMLLSLCAASRINVHTSKSPAVHGHAGGHWVEAPMSLEHQVVPTGGKSGRDKHVWADPVSEHLFNTDFGQSYVPPEALGNLQKKTIFYLHANNDASTNAGDISDVY